MTFEDLQKFLRNFNIAPSSEEMKPLRLAQYKMLIITATRWHGVLFGQWLADCFLPEGDVIAPGYEDSLSHYRLLFSSWEEMKSDFEESMGLFQPEIGA